MDLGFCVAGFCALKAQYCIPRGSGGMLPGKNFDFEEPQEHIFLHLQRTIHGKKF